MSSIINFPLDLRVGFKPGGALTLSRKSISLRSPFTGKRQALVQPYALWTYKGDLAMVDSDAAAMVRSFLVQLQGQGNKFRMPVPGVDVPGSNYGSTISNGGGPFVNGAGQTGSSLLLTWLVGSVMVFKRGDYFTVNDELKMVTSDCWSNSSGTATVNFVPPLRSSPANFANVKLGRWGSPLSANRLPYSNSFSTSPWVTYNAGISEPGTITDAFGGVLGWSFIPTATSAQHYITAGDIPIKPLSPFTASIYIKTNGYNNILIQCIDSSLNYGIGATYNVSTGVVNSTYGPGLQNRSTTLNATISNAGLTSGWYKLTLTGMIDSITTRMQIFATDGSYNPTFTGNGTSGYYLYNAQIEDGSVANGVHITQDGEGVPTVLMSANTDDIASWIYDVPVNHTFSLDLIEAYE